MSRYILILSFLLSSVAVSAQNTDSHPVDFMGGMGVTFVSTPIFNDYVSNMTSEGNSGSMVSTIGFFLESDYTIKSNFDIGIEYDNRYYSKNSDVMGIGRYEVSYTVHSPSLMAYYVARGEGYRFKFGGGAGYRYLSLSEKQPVSSKEDYSSSGFGALLKFQAHTLLGGNFYAYLSTDLKYDFIGKATDGDKTFGEGVFDEDVDFNSFGLSVKLGISYIIGL